ncbi:MAG TPA: ABC transporter permease, partial [Terriglobales bacterium]
MFLRLLYQSFRHQQRRKLLAGAAIMFGVALATAMVAVSVNIGDKLNHELSAYGANILLTPEDESLTVHVGGVQLKPVSSGAFLKESELPKMKGIFWGHNITGYSPMLTETTAVNGQTIEVTGAYFSHPVKFGKETFTTGVRVTNPWWRVQGSWPGEESNQVLLGRSLAGRLNLKDGDTLPLNRVPVQVSGILETGGNEENQIVAPLHLVQSIFHAPDQVQRVYVRALTKPEDAFARRDPEKLSPKDHDRWYCSPYANSIAFQLREAFPHARAEQIRQVAQSEGMVLSRISGLMLLITIAALIAAALAVSSAMATTVFERRREVGLMKSLGAGAQTVAALFLAEAAVLALLSGTAGYFFGAMLARQLGLSIFNSPIAAEPLLLPLVLCLAVLVTFAGS